MNRWHVGRRPFAAIALLCVSAVGIALVTQHGYGMLPCPWCVLQRLIFVTIALVSLPAVLLPRPEVRRAGALLAALLALGGIAAALYQHFVAAATTSCKLSLADKIMSATGLDEALPGVFAPWASCAEAAARLLGLPYEYYSLTLFVLILAAALWLLRRPRA
ncbi:MAG: disulfide bond formation protein B [Rubrivivax sp.]